MLVVDSARAGELRRIARGEQAKDRMRGLLAGERARSELKPDGGIEVSNIEAQLGRPMSAAAVIARLNRCRRNFHFEPSSSDKTKMGIYVIENRPDDTGSLRTQKRFVCGMESGFMPEFSVQHAKEEKQPDADHPAIWHTMRTFAGETRGWRTVLARLLRERLITQAQIDRYFNPAAGRASEKWQILTT